MNKSWKAYRLDDVVEKLIDYRGKTPEKTNKGIPLITAKVIKDGRINTPNEFIAEKTFNEWMTRGIPEYGDVVLTTEAPLGEVAQINIKGQVALAQRVITLRGKKGVLDNAFLKYFLQSPIGQRNLKSKETGSTVTGIKQSELRGIEISVPDFNEQQAITSILSSLDEKIEINMQMNHTLEAMAKAIFKEWFAGEEKKVFLSEYIEINPRIAVRKNSVLKYVEMSDLPEDGHSIKTFIERQYSSGSRFQKNDTLLARITPCLENGKTGFVDFLDDDEVAFGSTEFITMRAKERISPYYVYLIARDHTFREFAIKSMVGTSGRQRVQTDLLYSFELPKVSESKMRGFDSLVQPLFEKIKNNFEEIKTLTTIRDSLLPKLMSGKIEVKT